MIATKCQRQIVEERSVVWIHILQLHFLAAQWMVQPSPTADHEKVFSTQLEMLEDVRMATDEKRSLRCPQERLHEVVLHIRIRSHNLAIAVW